MSVSPLRRVVRELKPLGLRPTDHTFSSLVAIDNQGSSRVIDTIEKLEHFCEQLDQWASNANSKLKAVLLQKRRELLAWMSYARRAYKAKKLELALIAARLALCEAELVRIRYVADPIVRSKRRSNDALPGARDKSAEKRRKITIRKYVAAWPKARNRKHFATLLTPPRDRKKGKFLSLEAVRKFERKHADEIASCGITLPTERGARKKIKKGKRANL